MRSEARTTSRKISIRSRNAPKETRRPTVNAQPVVKWVGGKTRLLDELIERMPMNYGHYFEPFAGGAAMFFAVQPPKATISDSNEDLVNMYQMLAEHPDRVIRNLRNYRRQHNRDHYYAMRERWNGKGRVMTKVSRAAAFIYLNKTCFNGLWRVNRKGEFNVPVGRYDSPAIYRPAALRKASLALSKARVVAQDYETAVQDACKGDFVYFDPPYHPVNATANFTSYTAGSFGPEDQKNLADLARRLKKRGVSVMLSNSDTPFIRELYQDFNVDTVTCGRAINSNPNRRGSVNEVIVTSY